MVKKIEFKSQLSREKVDSLAKTFVPPSDYTYKVDVVKPRYQTMLDFNRSVGREVGQPKKPTPSFGTYYDYDRYVWEGNSHVFKNTKMSVIDFKKQSARYTKTR